MLAIVRAAAAALAEGRPSVLCRVVETRGSTPQKAGAAMLIYADGHQIGTLGGGCVEAEVKRRALAGLDPNVSHLMTYHLDHDYGWDDGLICGGRMSILADVLPPPPSEASALAAYLAAWIEREELGIGGTELLTLESAATIPIGARWITDAQGKAVAAWRAPSLPEAAQAGIAPLHPRPKPRVRGGMAYLPIYPRVALLIVGAGHVGQAVADLAARADFDVWVLDDRENLVSPERFPTAKRRLVGDLTRTLQGLVRAGTLGPTVYVIIVTRGHQHDEEALYQVVEGQAGYLGLIGSKRKIRLIFDDLRAKGIAATALERVHAPLGLNIGSQTVAEIAISIVAELIAFRNLGHVPLAMRDRAVEPVP